MNKKIAIIGTVGLPANYGGFETLAEHLTINLGERYNFTVYCSGAKHAQKLGEHNNAKLVYLPFDANGVQSIFYDFVSMLHALRDADILLILGVSGCVFLPIIKLTNKKKIIVNIDGQEWRREKWGRFAKWFLRHSEQSAVRNADIVVTDNKVIQDYVKSEYKRSSELIAYGADHVAKQPLSPEVLMQHPFLSGRYAFSVCRIEPENNLHIVLEAIAKQKELQIVVVGNWSANQYGQSLREEYAGINHIHLLDPIYDQGTLDQIRSNCFVYLHGHSAGGTNPSLVEAMYLRLPVFAYDVDYNKETTENCARYFSNSNELSEFINRIDEKALSLIGIKMAEIANRRYRWDIISRQYEELFNGSWRSSII